MTQRSQQVEFLLLPPQISSVTSVHQHLLPLHNDRHFTVSYLIMLTTPHTNKPIPSISLHEATVNFDFVLGLYKLLWNVDKKATKSQTGGRFTACSNALVSQYPKNKAQIQSRLCLSQKSLGDCLLSNTNTSKERMPTQEDKSV